MKDSAMKKQVKGVEAMIGRKMFGKPSKKGFGKKKSAAQKYKQQMKEMAEDEED